MSLRPPPPAGPPPDQVAGYRPGSTPSSQCGGPRVRSALGRRDASGLLTRPRLRQRPRSPLFFGVGPGCPGKGPVGASASPRPDPASSLPFPSRRRSPYPKDVVAFRAPARDLDALRGPHGGGRLVWIRAAPRPPRAPLLRVALGTWHSLPPESRAALPAGRAPPRHPRPL